MIHSYRNRNLKKFVEENEARKIDPTLVKRLKIVMDVIDAAQELGDLNLPGFDFHPLRGKPKRYSIHINGPWCVTFEWNDGDVLRLDLENYH